MEQALSGATKIVRHKGVEIIINDYSGLKGQELTAAMKENAKIIVPNVVGRRDCVMVNLFKNCLLTEDSVQYIFKARRAMDGTFIASAIVGMNNIQKAAYEISGTLTKSAVVTEFFENQIEAMDWAVEQHKKFTNRPS